MKSQTTAFNIRGLFDQATLAAYSSSFSHLIVQWAVQAMALSTTVTELYGCHFISQILSMTNRFFYITTLGSIKRHLLTAASKYSFRTKM
jgi:hypothetical protein